MMNYYGWGTLRPAFGFGWIFGIIFWILFVCLIVGLVRWYANGNKGGRANEEENLGRALDILKERYAKGEITKKEFDQMKKDIA